MTVQDVTMGRGIAIPQSIPKSTIRKVVFASSLGTVFEWYDFYLYGSLAAIISKQFFSAVNPTAAFIFAFAAGFAVRPFGALVFGRLGDLVGRKYTFLIRTRGLLSCPVIVSFWAKRIAGYRGFIRSINGLNVSSLSSFVAGFRRRCRSFHYS